MNNTEDKARKIFLGYLILTFYYLGALAMIFTITYPPFKEVHENFRAHAVVLERFLIWVLYIPGILMVLSAVALILFRPIVLPKWAVAGSAILSLISVLTMFFCMVPLHYGWTTAGFAERVFEQSKNTMLAFQIIPSILMAMMSVWFMDSYLSHVQRTTRLLFIALFVLCFFPMGTIIVECHLNYALWATVSGNEWPAYRQQLHMPVFLAVFLVPFYFPMILLMVIAFKKRNGLSRGLVVISLMSLLYVFIISAAYFVPDIQFELDKHYSRKLLEDLIRNEIWMRTPAELIYWATVAMMFWRFRTTGDNLDQVV